MFVFLLLPFPISDFIAAAGGVEYVFVHKIEYTRTEAKGKGIKLYIYVNEIHEMFSSDASRLFIMNKWILFLLFLFLCLRNGNLVERRRKKNLTMKIKSG